MADVRRVLFALANGGTGGMQSQVRLIASSLAERGVDVTIAVGGGDQTHTTGVTTVALPQFSTRRPVAFASELRRLVRRETFDVVHGHGLRVAPAIALSGAPARLVTCHGLDPTRAARAAHWVRRLPVSVIACGEGPRRVLGSFGVAARVINNAVSTSLIRHSANELHHNFRLNADVPSVLLPARFTEQKGHIVLVEVMTHVRARLGDKRPEVLCFGDGPLFHDIEQASWISGERPLVRCFPYRDDAAQWLSATDFFLLTSTWEGQPLVVLEALAAGLCVATCTPTGVEDLVMDGRNGRRVRTARDLADVVTEWCEQPASMPHDIIATTGILSDHRLDRVTDRYLEIYNQ